MEAGTCWRLQVKHGASWSGWAAQPAFAELPKGLSGRYSLNLCLNAIFAGSTDPNPERWAVTQAMIEAEIAKARRAKAEHSGEKAGPKQGIGFSVG